MVIFKGVGMSFSPHTPNLDRFIASAVSGQKVNKMSMTFASTVLEQAVRYAHADEGYIASVHPQPDSKVYFIKGVEDMVLDFEGHIRKLWGEGVEEIKGVRVGAFLRDVAGDINLVETYLRLGRQKKAIGVLIESFLHNKEVVQLPGSCDMDFGGHQGEVWVLGSCLLEELATEVLDGRNSRMMRI